MEPAKTLKKLQNGGDIPVLILGAPQSYNEVMETIRARVDTEAIEERYDFVRIFGTSDQVIRDAVDKTAGLLGDNALFWLCYPKKSSKAYRSDCSRESVSQIPADYGYEPVRQVAIDDDWSALRYRMVSDIKKMPRSFAYTEEGKKRTAGGQA